METRGRKVCIILVNYLNNNDTVRCIRSILDNVPDQTPYVVVVDNSAVQSSIETEISFYPDLKYLFPGENLGFARGNNLGIEWALNNLQSDYLFILNNDTIIVKETLGNLLTAAENFPGVRIFAPTIITEEEPSRIWYSGGDMSYLKMTPVIRRIGSRYDPSVLKDEFTFFASGCAIFLLADRDLIGDALFDPEFFMYDEDLELMIRLQKLHEKLLFVSRSVVIHKCQGSQKKDSSGSLNQLSPASRNLPFYLTCTIRNRFYIIKKHYTGSRRLILQITLTAYWLLKSLQFFLNFNFRVSKLVLEVLGHSGRK